MNAIIYLAAIDRAAEIRGSARDGNSPIEPRAPLLTVLVPSGMESLILKKTPQPRISIRKAVRS